MTTVIEEIHQIVEPAILGRPVGRPRVLTDEQREANKKEAAKLWREANREHHRAWDREYNKLEKRIEGKKQWYWDNRARVNERKRELYRLKQEALRSEAFRDA